MIRTIEELSMNAWPARQTILFDGWVLRFNNGYTRRANSITALYPARKDPSQKIAACEALYRAQGLPVIYKLPGRQESQTLDKLLADRGYIEEAQTSVQALALEDFHGDEILDVTTGSAMSAGWQEAFCRLSHVSEQNQAVHQQIIDAILPARCFASIQLEGEIVACGLGVLQDGYLGLYDIVVDAAFRRRGIGSRLMRALLAWGKCQDAHTAYLQVMLNNPPALALYAGLGFCEVYQYWYRVKV